MKKEQRKIYYILANEVDYAICSFCRYGSFTGSGCSGDGNYECDHPLWKVNEDEFDKAMELGDCWGFRPAYSVALAADIVGIILENGFLGTSWITRDGQLLIQGIKGERVY